jgi:hypothetical protein
VLTLKRRRAASASLWVVTLAAVAACSSGSAPLTGPSQPCTSFSETFVGAGPLDASDGLVVDYAPFCLPFSGPEVDGGQLSCSLFVTLATAGDESVCASMGLAAPSATDLSQIQSTIAANGGARFSASPTCMVPQLVGADLDDAGSCASSSTPGWCLETGPCPSYMLVVSPELETAGTLVTLGCALCGG